MMTSPARFLALPLLAAALPALGQDLATPADPPAPADLALAVPGLPDPASPVASVAPADSTVLPAYSAAYADGANLAAASELDAAVDLEASADEVDPDAPLVIPLSPAAPRAGAPSGFRQGGSPFSYSPAAAGPGETGRRFSFGIGASTVYDSNFFQSSVNEQDEVTFTLSPYLAFRTQGPQFTVGGRINLDYNAYLENSDFNGLGYDFAADATYEGGPLTANASISSGIDQGVNRYYGSNFVETSTVRTALGASYLLSPKTSLDGRFAYSWTEPDQGTLGQSDSTSFDLSAMWRATPLLRVGSGLSWSAESGENQVDRQTLGPILRAQYQLDSQISLDGTIGVDFVDFGGAGGSDTTFSGDLGIAWDPSILWGMDFTFYQGTSADGSRAGALAGAYRETTSFRLGYHRRILRSTLNLGLSYSIDDSSAPNGIAGPGSSDFISFDASLGMPVFADRANASFFYSWSEESGNPLRDWSGHQLGCSLSTSF